MCIDIIIIWFTTFLIKFPSIIIYIRNVKKKKKLPRIFFLSILKRERGEEIHSLFTVYLFIGMIRGEERVKRLYLMRDSLYKINL